MPTTHLGRSLVSGTLALALLTAIHRAAPAGAAPEPWPAFLGNARHTGLATVSGPRLLTLAWHTNTSDNVDTSPVIAGDGTVYLSSTGGTVQARFTDGGEKWSFNAGARLYASPVLGLDGEVLIGDTRGRFRALDPDDGEVRWTVGNLGSIRATAAVSDDGTVFVGTEGGQLLALDSRAAGKEKYRVAARAGIVAAPAIAASGDVYWAALDGELRRMSSRGDIIWSVALDGQILSSPSIGDDGTVYVGAGTSILALSPDNGVVKWRVGPGAGVPTTPVIGPDGTVYAGAENGRLIAVAPSGTVRWEYQTGAPILGSAAVGADGTVYVGSGDATVYALAPTGQRLSTYRALDAVYGSISIGPNGVVYAGSRDNRLYALRDDVRSFSPSPGDRLGGDVVRDPGTGRVFVIVDGQRRYIPDPTTQLLLGLTTPLPRTLNSAELARYPEGAALPALAEGSLISAANGPIYAIRNGQRVWVRSLAEFVEQGYRWDAVQAVEERVLRSLGLSLQEGMFLKGTGERVYLYTGGQRRWLATGQALAARGDWSQVHFVSEATLRQLPEGEALS